eukprot:jgi/Tetstr1/431076/TSEL_020793.t1
MVIGGSGDGMPAAARPPWPAHGPLESALAAAAAAAAARALALRDLLSSYGIVGTFIGASKSREGAGRRQRQRPLALLQQQQRGDGTPPLSATEALAASSSGATSDRPGCLSYAPITLPSRSKFEMQPSGSSSQRLCAKVGASPELRSCSEPRPIIGQQRDPPGDKGVGARPVFLTGGSRMGNTQPGGAIRAGTGTAPGRMPAPAGGGGTTPTGNVEAPGGWTYAVPAGGSDHVSPYGTPSSPLHYAPQTVGLALEGSPGGTPGAGGSKPSQVAFTEPAEPNKLPIVLTWAGGGTNVELQGSFDNWHSRQPMQQTHAGHTLVKLLTPGVYQYKFIVDGEWRYAADQPAIMDEMGNVNNVVEVHEYEPDLPGNISGFDGLPSPPASYTCPALEREDFAKDPPLQPPHLQLTLLNLPAAQEWPSCLPRPQHVVLNHFYSQRSTAVQACVLGTTTRYKSKYITTVLYKPMHPPPS